MFVKNGGRLVDCTVLCTAANDAAWLLLWGRLLFTQLFRYAAVTAVVLLKHSGLPTQRSLYPGAQLNAGGLLSNHGAPATD